MANTMRKRRAVKRERVEEFSSIMPETPVSRPHSRKRRELVKYEEDEDGGLIEVIDISDNFSDTSTAMKQSPTTSSLSRKQKVTEPCASSTPKNKRISKDRGTKLITGDRMIRQSAKYMYIVSSGSKRTFICKLCDISISSLQELRSHLECQKHLNNLLTPYFCHDCLCKCSSEYNLQRHLSGKKHAKTLCQSPNSDLVPVTYGDLMDYYSRAAAPSSTIGESDYIMDLLLTAKGPILGLQYAVVLYFNDKGQTSYDCICTVCGSSYTSPTEWNEHFQCYDHLLRVLKFDYKDKYAALRAVKGKQKALELFKIAKDIEYEEGRQYHLVRRSFSNTKEQHSLPTKESTYSFGHHHVTVNEISSNGNDEQCVAVNHTPLPLDIALEYCMEFAGHSLNIRQLQTVVESRIIDNDSVKQLLKLSSAITQAVLVYHEEQSTEQSMEQ